MNALEVYFEVARLWHRQTGQQLFRLNDPALPPEFGTLADIKAFHAAHAGQGDSPEQLAQAYIAEALESAMLAT
jgi:hypothetical protein